MTQEKQTGFAGWMGSMWLYTLLRFGLFFALWGLLVLVGLHGLFAALLALVVSIPLSLILLAAPRARVAANIEQRVNARRELRAELDRRLDPERVDPPGPQARGESAVDNPGAWPDAPRDS